MNVGLTTLLVILSFLLLPSLYQNILVQGQEQEPPVANASPDQTVNERDFVILDGTGSFDPDGKIVSYAWGIEDSDDEAPAVWLSGQNASNATFTAPVVIGDANVNSYLFELTVTDDDGLIDSDTVKVVVVRGAGGN